MKCDTFLPQLTILIDLRDPCENQHNKIKFPLEKEFSEHLIDLALYWLQFSLEVRIVEE
jgi:hypothetical protein